MSGKVPFSAIQKMNAAAEIEYEVELKAETDPKLKARVAAQDNAAKHLVQINQILDKVKHLIDGNVEYEIYAETKLKKPGKRPGAKSIMIFTNPNTGEVIHVEKSGKSVNAPEQLLEWFDIHGITMVAGWASVPENEE